jgi:transaldolase
VVVKIPLIKAGIKALRALDEEGIRTNCTLCFSPTQALLAAKAGADYISPFIGRVDDISSDGMTLIEEIRQIYDNYDFDTDILAASIRHPTHVKRSALAGADVATMPFETLTKLLDHPLTDRGLERFLADWDDYQEAKEEATASAVA